MTQPVMASIQTLLAILIWLRSWINWAIDMVSALQVNISMHGMTIGQQHGSVAMAPRVRRLATELQEALTPLDNLVPLAVAMHMEPPGSQPRPPPKPPPVKAPPAAQTIEMTLARERERQQAIVATQDSWAAARPAPVSAANPPRPPPGPPPDVLAAKAKAGPAARPPPPPIPQGHAHVAVVAASPPPVRTLAPPPPPKPTPTPPPSPGQSTYETTAGEVLAQATANVSRWTRAAASAAQQAAEAATVVQMAASVAPTTPVTVSIATPPGSPGQSTPQQGPVTGGAGPPQTWPVPPKRPASPVIMDNPWADMFDSGADTSRSAAASATAGPAASASAAASSGQPPDAKGKGQGKGKEPPHPSQQMVPGYMVSGPAPHAGHGKPPKGSRPAPPSGPVPESVPQPLGKPDRIFFKFMIGDLPAGTQATDVTLAACEFHTIRLSAVSLTDCGFDMPVCLQPRVLPVSCLPVVSSRGFPTLLPVSFVPAMPAMRASDAMRVCHPSANYMCVISFGQCKHCQIRAFLGYYANMATVTVRFSAASGMGMAFVAFEVAGGDIDEARRQCEAAYARARQMWTVVFPLTHLEVFHCHLRF